VVIVGPRRAGKTILLEQLREKLKGSVLLLNGEDFDTADLLSSRNIAYYRNLLSGYEYLFIDEAQKITGIGNILKLIVDSIQGIKIVVTGSSAFDIGNVFGEPLTGRKITFTLLPFGQIELSHHESTLDTKRILEEKTIFGMYPEVFHYNTREQKISYLRELANDYLFKDILMYEEIRNPTKIRDLIRLIAFQTGSEVSYDELGRQLGINKNTVERYLDLLTKVFVLYKVQGFSRNLRKEIRKSHKWYFYDTGIRNAVISNFNVLSLRQDVGQLWENYLISERLKCQHYTGMQVSNHFWRTYDGQEIDWIEEREGKLYGYEIKWKHESAKIPAAWKRAYPDAKFNVISQDNYLEWIK
jgi:uncharacterized protein